VSYVIHYDFGVEVLSDLYEQFFLAHVIGTDMDVTRHVFFNDFYAHFNTIDSFRESEHWVAVSVIKP
jgi:hypothetical protein